MKSLATTTRIRMSSVAVSPEYTLHEGDLFPNYDGRATSFTLIEPTLSQDNIPHSTDYSMPWQI